MFQSVSCPRGHVVQVAAEPGAWIACPYCGAGFVVPQGTHAGMPPRAMGGRPAARPAWLLPAAIGGGMLAIIAVLAVILLTMMARDERRAPLAGSETNAASPLGFQEPILPDETLPYPRLPGAVTRLPDWLRNSAPFDADALFAHIPPEENAAPLYLEALVEFDGEAAACFPPEQREQLRQRGAERGRRIETLYKAWYYRDVPYDPADIDRLLDELAPAFEKLAAAQQRPGCVFESGIDLSALLPYVQAIRAAARAGVLQIERDIARNDVDVATSMVERLLRLSRDSSFRGMLVVQLVSMAVETIVLDEVRKAAAHPNVRPEHCERWLAILRAHEGALIDRHATGVRMDYLSARMLLSELEFRPAQMHESLKPYLQDEGVRTLGELFAPQGDAAAARRIDDYVASLKPHELRAHVQAFDNILALCERVRGERFDSNRDYFGEVLEHTRDRNSPLAAHLSIPPDAFLEADIGAAVELHATQCVLALHLWKKRHGTPAARLEDALREAGIAQVPVDDYAQAPLRFRDDGGQLIVYSIGRDGLDQNGAVDWRNKTVPGDYLFVVPK